MQNTQLTDWNGNTVNYIQSKGGVTVLLNPLENLIKTNVFPWPTPEIVQKLSGSNRSSSFTQQTVSELTGYYTDLQSMNSEDAITWSVFGTLRYQGAEARNRFIAELLEMAGVNGAYCENTHVWVWRRVPHPDTTVSGGPELDFGIITDNTLVFGESKWNSAITVNQGKQHNKNQIQLRVEFLEKYGQYLFPNIQNKMVLLITREKDQRFNRTTEKGVTVNNLLWADICSMTSHPLHEEVERYYQWKKQPTNHQGGVKMKKNSVEYLKLYSFLNANVKAMIAAIENGEPPLNGVVEEMEAKKLVSMVNKEDHFTIGRMVTEILEPRGYRPLIKPDGNIKRKDLTKSNTIIGQQLFEKINKRNQSGGEM